MGRVTFKYFDKALITLFIILMGLSGCQKKPIDLHSFDFKQHIENQSKNCANISYSTAIHRLQYFDFDADQVEEVLIEATVCSPTTSPNFHTIYRSGSGKLEELKIDDNHGFHQGEPIYRGLVGKYEYNMRIQDGGLVQTFSDNSGRKSPLIIHYLWAGEEFTISKVIKAPTFKTSYDCSKAETAQEVVICGDRQLAEFDIQMELVYSKLLSNSDSDSFKTIKEQQLQWLKTRDIACLPNSKMIPCLTEQYSVQLDELSDRYYLSYLQRFKETQPFHIPKSILKVSPPNFSINSGPELRRYYHNSKPQDDKYVRAMLDGILANPNDKHLLLDGIESLVSGSNSLTVSEKRFLFEYVVANHLDYLYVSNCFNCGEYDYMGRIIFSLSDIYLRQGEELKAISLLARTIKAHKADFSDFLLGRMYYSYARSLWGAGRKLESIRFLRKIIGTYSGSFLYQLTELYRSYKSSYPVIQEN